MNNQNTGDHACYCPYNPELEDDEDDWDDPSAIQYAKESYIKHVRLDLGSDRTYCQAKEMAKAIGGGSFTEEFVLDICRDSQSPVTNFHRNGKTYVAIDPFLEKFKAGLTFEDAPTDSQ